ncbi:hypothetical protein [Hyphomicrobium sp.]|uniref:hypothetical protein n=1 Tax=Hyphomicrobium sp. TaxID=82 RepID=UPI001DE19EB0|nr:hypothetical protein [Hyphomicrobium sp.]MBY0560099.1 hypothetical protein [Hyphomicrobium sp.]
MKAIAHQEPNEGGLGVEFSAGISPGAAQEGQCVPPAIEPQHPSEQQSPSQGFMEITKLFATMMAR